MVLPVVASSLVASGFVAAPTAPRVRAEPIIFRSAQVQNRLPTLLVEPLTAAAAFTAGLAAWVDGDAPSTEPTEPTVVSSWYDAGFRLQGPPAPRFEAAAKRTVQSPAIETVETTTQALDFSTMAPPVGFEWGVDLAGNLPAEVPAATEEAAPATLTSVVSWYDAGEHGDVVWPPPKVEMNSWPSLGGKAGPHRGAGTMPPPPERELWTPPPGWTRPTVNAALRPAPLVSSWYDAGLRLGVTVDVMLSFKGVSESVTLLPGMTTDVLFERAAEVHDLQGKALTLIVKGKKLLPGVVLSESPVAGTSAGSTEPGERVMVVL